MQNTKDNILLEALRLFAVNGYSGVSVRDISGKLGIAPSALYKHYKSKRDIFDSIVKRMEEDDYQRAKEFGVPEDAYFTESESYCKTTIEEIREFSKAQFKYWTEYEFAFLFRKMLTIEHYRNNEMSALYQNYLSGGVVTYLEDIFREIMPKCNKDTSCCKMLAVEFYSPIYMLMNLYDSAENKDKISEMAYSHIDNFTSSLISSRQNH